MPPAVQTRAAARAVIATPGGGVRIGTGRARLDLAAPPRVELRGPSARVAVPGPPRTVVVGGRQGPAGRPGEGIEIEIYVAAAALGGHRAVALDGSGRLVYASAALGLPAIGLIRDAVVEDGEVAVHRRGRVGGFSGLEPGAVHYLAAGGLLSLTPPVEGMLQPLGVAASPTELLVDPDYPTLLT